MHIFTFLKSYGKATQVIEAFLISIPLQETATKHLQVYHSKIISLEYTKL